jgi:Fe-S cluster assembly scaffold protein SufB
VTAPVTEGAAEASTESTAANRRRPARRGPADLPFTFPDLGLAKALAAERSEPAWLRAERIAAAKAYESLPLEKNHLYKTYVDLRTADLFSVRPYVRTASVPSDVATAAPPPDDVSAIIVLREDTVTVLAVSPAAAAAGVTLETFGATLARDPAALRTDLAGGGTLPADDKLAQLSRGFWSQGVRLVVPDGVRLEHPVIVRWAAGVPDRALVTRTVVHLGVDAEAKLVEELVASGPAVECAAGEPVPQSLFTGTLEISLAARARLAVASI